LVASAREVIMSDERWEEQFKQFLRKTGDDFRRAGEDIKAEAQRLFDAAMDPDQQQRVRDRLKELSSWARKTAEDVAETVETAASKAAEVFHSATDKVTEVGEDRATASASSAQRKRARANKKATGGKIKGKPPRKNGGKRKR
jgi:DNA repair ATPase RecN